MKKQFIMVPDMFDKNIIRVAKYTNGIQNESFGIFVCEQDTIKKELEAEGWIYSIWVNYLQEQIKTHLDKVEELCQTIRAAMESGNYIIEYDREE